VGQSAELFRHREASLPETTFRRGDLHVKGVREVGARQRNSERETQRRPIELIDGDNRERSRLRLLGAPGRLRIGPNDVALSGNEGQ